MFDLVNCVTCSRDRYSWQLITGGQVEAGLIKLLCGELSTLAVWLCLVFEYLRDAFKSQRWLVITSLGKPQSSTACENNVKMGLALCIMLTQLLVLERASDRLKHFNFLSKERVLSVFVLLMISSQYVETDDYL